MKQAPGVSIAAWKLILVIRAKVPRYIEVVPALLWHRALVRVEQIAQKAARFRRRPITSPRILSIVSVFLARNGWIETQGPPGPYLFGFIAAL